MKIVLMLSIILMASGCGLFEKSKPTLVDTTVKVVQPLAVKHLNCRTGDALAEDLREQLDRLLKVQRSSQGNSSLAQSSVWSTACSSLVSAVLPFLVDLGDGQLPEDWRDDGCSLANAGGSIKDLAVKLCGGSS